MDLTATWYASAAAAWGCYAFGIWTFRVSRGEPLFLGVAKAALVACPVILSCFGIHATRQYEVALARTSVKPLEVASGDSGRERTIERIETSDGIHIEREHIAGWRLVSAEERGRATHRTLLQRDAGCERCSQCDEGCRRESEGCACCILGVPGCSCGNRGDSVAIGQGSIVLGNNF